MLRFENPGNPPQSPLYHEGYLILLRLACENALESLFTRIAGSTGIDELLTVGKGRLTTMIMEETQRLLDQCNTGISIAGINIIAIDPPQKVMGAFKDVSDAKLDCERIINEA